MLDSDGTWPALVLNCAGFEGLVLVERCPLAPYVGTGRPRRPSVGNEAPFELAPFVPVSDLKI